MDHKSVIVTRRIGTDLDQYATFFDHAWARATLAKVSSGKLSAPFTALCLAWKDAANTHRLPWLMITQMESFVEGFLREHRPHGMRLIDALKLRLRNELGGSVRNMAKNKIDEALDRIDADVRKSEESQDVSISPHAYWDMIIDQSEFQSSIVGSQSLSYCALIFAYEWFVVGCFRLLGGPEKHKPNENRVWEAFEKMLGRDVRPDYWDDKPVKVARLARNCIVHLGGEAKQELLDESPALYVSPEGVITIQATDTRGLYAVLQGKVTQFVDEVLPKLLV